MGLKKYNKNWKVQFEFDSNTSSEHRRIWWRVVPTELPLLKRWFSNDWNELYHAYKWVGGTDKLYSIDEYYKDVAPMKTVGDVLEYLNKQDVILQERHEKRIKAHEIWPDKKID